MTKTPLHSLSILIIGWLVAEIKSFESQIYSAWRAGLLPSRRCPYCGGGDLRVHQVRDRMYQEQPRDRYVGGRRPRTKVMRLRCRGCGRTCTVLPSFLSPRRLYVVRRRQRAVLGVLEAGQRIDAVSRELGYVVPGLVRRWLWAYRARVAEVRARLQQLVAERGDEATVRCGGDEAELLRCWTRGLIEIYEPYAEERWWEQLHFLLAQSVAQGRRSGGWLRTL